VIDASENINVKKKTAQIHNEIVKIVEKQMGLKLSSKPVIHFRLMSEPLQNALPDNSDSTQTLENNTENPKDKKDGILGSLFSRNKKDKSGSKDKSSPSLDEITPIKNPLTKKNKEDDTTTAKPDSEDLDEGW